MFAMLPARDRSSSPNRSEDSTHPTACTLVLGWGAHEDSVLAVLVGILWTWRQRRMFPADPA